MSETSVARSIGPAARATGIAACLTSLLVACQYVGVQTSPTPDVATAAPAVTPAPSTSPPNQPTGSPTATPAPTASPSASDAYDGKLHDQATHYLQLWAQAVGDAPPDAIVFIGELTRGGGWRGGNADNVKTAFLAGMIEAVEALPTATPPPAQISWPDGTTQAVSLLSAAEALTDMVANAEAPGSCAGCQPVKVTGAKLVTGQADTSHGPATVPLWQFEFVPADEPMTPITHVAVRDRVIPPARPPWDPYGSNPVGTRIDAVYGSAYDTSLTAVFLGAPLGGDSWCGADYTAEAVESDLAVVVIIHAEQHPPSAEPSPAGCLAVGRERSAVVNLASPLGSRTVLEVQFGQPVVLLSGGPPADVIG
jgi:hypothetical protein